MQYPISWTCQTTDATHFNSHANSIGNHRTSNRNITNQRGFSHPIAKNTEKKDAKGSVVHLVRGSSSTRSRRRCRTAAWRRPRRCAAAWATPDSPEPPQRGAWDRKEEQNHTHIFRLPESLRAQTQLNGESRQGIQGGVARDLRMRGGETGDVAARNGLAIGDLGRSAADLAAAAAAERHKDAMVWFLAMEDGRADNSGFGSQAWFCYRGFSPWAFFFFEWIAMGFIELD